MLEDSFVPALRAYLSAPQGVKSTVGWLYSRIPKRIRYGSDYERWVETAQLRDPAALARDANNRLASTLTVALESVPAYRPYRQLLNRLDDPVAVLAQLPIIGKADIKRDLMSYVSTKLSSRHRLQTFTGGSTTNPMRFYLQRNVSRVREYAFMNEFHARIGMSDGDRVLALRGRTVPSARAGGALWMREPIKNQMVMSSDHLKPEYMPEYVSAMRRWRPEFIQAFPSALYPLAKWLALNADQGVANSIRGVMLYSETVHPHQLALFRHVFHRGPVLMHYGHSERCAMAATLPSDDRYFFWPQYGHLELIDERGNLIIKPGEAGEIVCTSFDNAVMPFVRYRTGDRGVLGQYVGSPLPGFQVLDRIEGRLQEMVQCADGRLISITTLGAAHFNELASVTAIQFEQHRRGELVLKVETQTPLGLGARRSIERAVESKTQGGCNVRVEEVPHIPRTGAGKQLMLLQHLNLVEEFAAPVSSAGTIPRVEVGNTTVRSKLGLATTPVKGTGEIVMVGTALNTQGGISAVLSVLSTAPDFLGHGVSHLPTHCDGTKLTKFRIAAIAWVQYLRLLVTRKVRLLHVHSSSGPSFWRKFMFVAPTILLGKPVVLHWHGGRFVSFYDQSSRVLRRVIAWVFVRSDRVVALSTQWRDTLEGIFPTARLVVLPNPVAVPASAASLADSPPSVLFLGRIVEAKGVFDLLCAWQRTHQFAPDARLVLAGVGDLDAARSLAESLDIQSTVDFAGWVDGDAKLEMLRRATVFVLPSHAEAMPMAVLEAMAWGLPIVATRVGGIPHAVRDGQEGLLFEVGDSIAMADALTSLLTDRNRREAMGASARRRVEDNFSADLIVPRLKQVWRDVLAEHGDLGPV